MVTIKTSVCLRKKEGYYRTVSRDVSTFFCCAMIGRVINAPPVCSPRVCCVSPSFPWHWFVSKGFSINRAWRRCTRNGHDLHSLMFRVACKTSLLSSLWYYYCMYFLTMLLLYCCIYDLSFTKNLADKANLSSSCRYILLYCIRVPEWPPKKQSSSHEKPRP